jgi:uncharacterized protein (DUF433 family)
MKRGTTVIEIDPEVSSGTPVFAGTRVPAGTLLERLDALKARCISCEQGVEAGVSQV